MGQCVNKDYRLLQSAHERLIIIMSIQFALLPGTVCTSETLLQGPCALGGQLNQG